MKKENYILWLPSWYPNQLQPYNGDFVQRHARATALHVPVHVIHVVKDEKGQVTDSVHTETRSDGQLTETFIYYHFPERFPAFLNRWLSHRRYVALYKKAIGNLVLEKGKPSLLHVYIALKAGLLASWCQKEFGLAYVVGEQSTLYLTEAMPNLQDEHPYFQKAAAKIFRRATGVMVVSKYLGDALVKQFGIADPVVIPNVVDEKIFHPAAERKNSRTTFIHVSNLTWQKNAEGMIEAFRLVKEKGFDFELQIIGPHVPAVVETVKSASLENNVFLYHEMPQPELVKLVQAADAMVLFSRYETFGCVVIESFACGRPLILSDIPVFHENATAENALFAQNENPEDLAEKILQFMAGSQFNSKLIAEKTIACYNFNVVGGQIADWYRQVLSSP